MTETEILSMQAGRELDALVHQKVMGKKAIYVAEKPFILEEDPSSPLGIRCNFGGAVFTRDREWLVNDYYDPEADTRVPDYSRDISAAWQVLERMVPSPLIWYEHERKPLGWHVRLRDQEYHLGTDVVCSLLPEAICKAALLVYEQEAVKQDV